MRMPVFVALALAMGSAPVPEPPITLPEPDRRRRRFDPGIRMTPAELADFREAMRAPSRYAGHVDREDVRGAALMHRDRDPCPYKHKQRKNDRVCQFCGVSIRGTG